MTPHRGARAIAARTHRVTKKATKKSAARKHPEQRAPHGRR
jgi:hypothetical protein